MPIITIQTIKGVVLTSDEQKRDLLKKMTDTFISVVGELARRSGVAVSALHFYERRGLISSRRTSGNQRRYSRDTLRRVAFIRASQRVGIPLKGIADALSTMNDEQLDKFRADREKVAVGNGAAANLDVVGQPQQ